jgi:hypothetical protein
VCHRDLLGTSGLKWEQREWLESNHRRKDRAKEENRTKQTPREKMKWRYSNRLFGKNNLKEGATLHAPVARKLTLSSERAPYTKNNRAIVTKERIKIKAGHGPKRGARYQHELVD